nr:Holliday junction branch migration protein RuvA [uncultured Campylobacter sp.]
MIAAIEGIITCKEPTACVIKCASGVSYALSLSLNTSTKLTQGKLTELACVQILREDTDLLYGFLDESEKRMFETLIKLSGVGASTAMAVCSTLAPQDFARCVATGDAATLTSVPGIGPKTARRIIAELGDAKLMEFGPSETYKNEAASALQSLGFKRDKINQILAGCSSTNTSDLVKEALKKLA